MWRKVALLLSLAAVAAAGEQLSAPLEWEPGFLGSIYFRHYALSSTPPDGIKVPEGLVDPRYGLLEFAGGVRVAVVHEGGGEARGLWVDTDIDGDLAEEKPTPWKPYHESVRTNDTVTFSLPGEDEPLPVLFSFQRPRPDDHDHLGVVTRIHRRGWIELGGRLRPVALVDGNGDLRFDDAEHDRVYLDLDGNGELHGLDAPWEMLRFGEPFALAGNGYAVEGAQPLGGRVIFRRLPKAPPPRRWLKEDRTPPPARELPPPPIEPFAPLAARFDGATERGQIRLLADVARYGSDDAFKLLARVAEEGTSAAVRVEAVRQMGYVPYKSHAAAVAKLAREHPDLEVRRAAVAALHRMDAPGRDKVYARILRDTHDSKQKDLVEDAALHLAYFGTPQSRAALLREFRGQEDHVLRLQILQGAGRGDPGGPPEDLVALAVKDDDAFIKYQALEKYWALREPKAHAVAIGILESRDDMIFALVAAAIRTLAYDADKAAMRALLPWADRGNDDVWYLLRESLRLARDPAVTKEVAEGLRGSGPRQRALCADLLAGMREPVATEALAKALAKEREEWVAERMLEALAAHEEQAFDALVKLARQRNFPAREKLLVVLAGVGKGSPVVLEFFRDALTSAKWEERVLALDVAGATGDVSLAPVILKSLAHEAWQVRLAAVEALIGVRVREAVQPLIERLAKEDSARVRVAIGETLFRLTGVDLLDAEEAWRAWYAANGTTFAIPAEPPARQADEGGTVARFYGLPVRTERVCFVLDRSESMEGVHAGDPGKRTRLQVAVAELEAAVKRLPDRARVNVVLFDSEVESWKKSLVPLSDANRAALARFLGKQAPTGMTALYDALEAALLTEGVDTIYLLSDGEPTRGRNRDTESIVKAVRFLNQTRRIAIFTVAVGRESALLRRLAEEHGGRYARR